MMRIILLGLLFIGCSVAISKGIAVLIPTTVFFTMAHAINITGSESVVDFMVAANIAISVVLSAILVRLLIKKS